uniref:Glutathione synthetase n=1 Tax=Globodera rostochiensis TaxID=31243 RepID=A0A914HKP7_GLORO
MSAINAYLFLQKTFITLTFLLVLECQVSATPVSINAIPENVLNSVATRVKGDEQLQELVEDAVDWAHHIGMAWRADKKIKRSDNCVFVPFTLFPSPFPRALYQQAVDIQTDIQLLYFRVSNDYDFMFKTLEPVAKTDYAINKWLKVYTTIHKEGNHQPLTLLLTRSDYMGHLNKNNQRNEQNYELKQVEVNIGQIGGMAIANRTTDLHRRMLSKVGDDNLNNQLPPNDAEGIVAQGLYEAWKAFGIDDAIIIAVAGSTGRNIEKFQVGVRVEQLSGNKIKIVKLSLVECDDKLELDENDYSLRYKGQLIAVVFYQTTVEAPPAKYVSARLKIERSTAIKSPTIGVELTGAKKVQQALSMPGVLEHFLPEPENAKKIERIRNTFAKMWGLEKNDDETEKIIKDAIANPDNYVLKPSKECGGNNFWGQEIAEKLRTFEPSERAAHILMERLRPPVVKNYMVRPAEEVHEISNVVSELSIYGYLLGNSTDMSVLLNKREGYMVRSKGENSNEGGVQAGGGAHDSPYLV